MNIKKYLIGMLLGLSYTFFAAQQSVARKTVKTLAECSSLTQQEKDELYIQAVVDGRESQAKLLLDARARFDGGGENLHRFLPEETLSKLVTVGVQVAGSDEQQQGENTEEKLAKRIAIGDVAAAWKRPGMVRFLANRPRGKERFLVLGHYIASMQGDVETLGVILDYGDAVARVPWFGPKERVRHVAHDNTVAALVSGQQSSLHHMLSRDDIYKVDLCSPSSDRSLFHVAVYAANKTGSDAGLERLLQHERESARFPELNSQIRDLRVAPKGDYYQLANLNGNEYRLVEHLKGHQDDSGMQDQPAEDDSGVHYLQLTSKSPRTSLTLRDAAGKTPLAFARDLLADENKQEEESAAANDSDARLALQRCVQRLERQPYELADALIKRYTLKR